MHWAQATCESLATLGRPFALGQLYDIRRHKILPETAWPAETIQRMSTRRDGSPSVSASLDCETTKKQRTRRLEMSAELRFHAGFRIFEKTLTGSASYLTEANTFKVRDSISFHYDVKGGIEELHCDTEDADGICVKKDSPATHVVTGLRFGGKAFIICNGWSDRTHFMELASSDCGSVVEGAAFKIGRAAKSILDFKLPQYSSQSAGFRVSDCFTDFMPPASPLISPVDVLNYFKSLRSADANTLMEVYLTPIGYFKENNKELLPRIKSEQLEEVCDYLDALDEAVERSDSLLDEFLAATHSDFAASVTKAVIDYKADLNQHKVRYVREIKKLVTCDRLKDLMKTHNKLNQHDRFSTERLQTSLSALRRDVEVVSAEIVCLRQCETQRCTEASERLAERSARKFEKQLELWSSLEQEKSQLSDGSQILSIKREKFVAKLKDESVSVTWCPICVKTCHEDCKLDSDEAKINCGVMCNEICKVCNCHWSKHRNRKKYIERQPEVQNITAADVAARYGVDLQQTGAVCRLDRHLADDAERAVQRLAHSLVAAYRCWKMSLPDLDQGIEQFAKERIEAKQLTEAAREALMNKLIPLVVEINSRMR